ncbi:MAG: nodulation protein NfeD [Candidatus Xenobiia bacterium LiM19]
MKKILIVFLFLVFLTSLPMWAFRKEDQPVVELKLNGPIIPITADYIIRGIEYAEQKDSILILELDTPGGLDKSMRQIIHKILDSSVPVVIYVYPDGSRAASAGVYMLYSAHVAAMAPSTNLGSAHPVSINMTGGDDKKEDKTMMEKVTNDSVAYIKALAEKRGRNAKWAEDAVRKSVSITATEALKEGVIDIVARDVPDLLKQMDGRKVKLKDGEVVLRPSQSVPEKVPMTGVERFLLIISDPSIALILMMLGLSGLAYEFMSPGAILPGVVGGICFILALYSFGSLPINYAGLFLIIFAVILFIADVKAQSHGVLTVGGIVSMILGAVLLIPTDYPYLAISKAVIIGVTVITSGFFIFLIAMVAKSLHRKPVSGKEGMIGATVKALTDIGEQGTAAYGGEIWNAEAVGDVIKKGGKAVIVEVQGLTLKVRQRDEEDRE